MWPLRESLEAHVKPLVPSSGDIKVIEHKYGSVVWVQSNLGKNYAAHTWVKRNNGWKLLQTSEIAVHGSRLRGGEAQLRRALHQPLRIRALQAADGK